VLEFNTSGGSNTAVGNSALEFNNTGNSNTATGQQALTNNSDGSNNAAFGMFALQLNTSGSNNTAIGFSALRGGSLLGDYNTALGSSALYRCKGSYNTAIGTDAGRNVFLGNNNICIRNLGASESNTIRIGNATHTNTFIAGISGTTVPTGVAVIVDGSGHLGTTTSSARFKEAIKPMDKASEAILALKPVTFRYKPEIDADGIPQFGLVAEDVEKVNPDLVARNDEGKPYTVRYEAVNAMLLNEFLKEHRKVEKLETTVEQQQKQIAALTSQMLQVNEQLRANKLPPQLVVDN